jgi:ABC-type antimicrobial peptide transport system permease subunit
MFFLARRSLRYRTGAFVAAFLAALLGATLVMTFASLLDTAMGDGVPSTSQETLFIMASVVGGWGLILVAFAVTSTLTLAVHQRATEIALLKSIGAEPGQVRRMIVGEAAIVTVVGAVLAVIPSVLAGRGLLELLIDTEQVAATVGYRFGPIAPVIGLVVTVAGGTFAAHLTARRAVRLRATEAMQQAEAVDTRMSRKRWIFGIVFLLLGLDLAVVTATAMRGLGTDAMQTAGQTSIWVAIGFALLGPALLRRTAGFLGGYLRRFGGSGELAALNLGRRAGEMSGILMPIILFTGIATGTLYMQETDNAAVAREGLVPTTSQENIATLNLVVIGMILLFAAIMLINTLITVTARRRDEFGRQRLAGATPRQVLGMVTAEGVVLTVTGVVFGTIASIFTIIPFAIARSDAVLPDGSPLIYVGVVVVAAALTLVTALIATARTLRTPAVNAVAV